MCNVFIIIIAVTNKDTYPLPCCCYCYQVTSVVSNSVRPHRRQHMRLPRPWDSPGKNIGVGCHFLLNAWKWKVKVKSRSHVRPPATPWTAAFQAPPSMGFSRQEYWSGVPLRLRMSIYIVHWFGWLVTKSCLTLSDPMDCSPPGYSGHGIFQARVLQWGAIAFSFNLLVSLQILLFCSHLYSAYFIVHVVFRFCKFL